MPKSGLMRVPAQLRHLLSSLWALLGLMPAVWRFRHGNGLSRSDFVPEVAEPDAPAIAEPDAPAIAPAIATAKRRRKRSGKPRVRYARDLGELLDRLDETFRALQIAKLPHTYNITPADLRAGLRRMGPFVFPGDSLPWHYDQRVDVAQVKKWSTMIFVASAEGGGGGDEETMLPDFFYAFRYDKFGSHVERAPGDLCYECGAAYREVNNPGSSKLYWSSYPAWIDSHTGEVKVTRLLNYEYIQVKGARGRSPRDRQSYTRKSWQIPELARSLTMKGESDRGVEHRMHVLEQMTALTFNVWMQRNHVWSVGVRKDKERATFGVPQEQVKHYFRDRGRTALAENGRLRPIIHHVIDHDRHYLSGKVAHVKEHLRGLREFNWRGYECAVSAPTWHMLSSDFDLVGRDAPDDSPILPPGWIGVDGIGSRLARAEDEGRRLR